MIFVQLILAWSALLALIITFFGLALYMVSIFPYGWMTPPFVPTNKKLAALIATTLNPEPSSTVYELGAGDMRVSLAAWKLAPHARYIGIEMHSFPRWVARYNIWCDGAAAHVSVREGNIFTTDLSEATHVYCYLFPKVMQELLPQFERELKPGSIVVSLDFDIKAKAPETVIDLAPYNLRLGKKLYVYRF